MNIRILKNCDVRLNGVIKALAAWTELNLPGDKAKKLVDAGFAENCKPTIDDYRKAVTEFARCDPGGDCWEWIKKSLPDLWRNHIKALQADDIATVRLTHNDMLAAWGGRQRIKEAISQGQGLGLAVKTA